MRFNTYQKYVVYMSSYNVQFIIDSLIFINYSKGLIRFVCESENDTRKFDFSNIVKSFFLVLFYSYIDTIIHELS